MPTATAQPPDIRATWLSEYWTDHETGGRFYILQSYYRAEAGACHVHSSNCLWTTLYRWNTIFCGEYAYAR